MSLLASMSAAILQPRYEFEEEWQLWKSDHGKNYDSQRDELERHLVWLSNREYIQQHNANAKAGVFGYTLALNRFGDMVKFIQIQVNGYHISVFLNTARCRVIIVLAFSLFVYLFSAEQQ